jgi:hypothetical protein
MRRLLAAAAAVVALASTAAATVVLRVTPRELADKADLVVEGRVAAVDVRWDDDRTCINTYVTFTVERSLKGNGPGSVVITVPGGKVGDEEVRVEGTAQFARDEEAVVFLWKSPAGEWGVLGEGQGKFRLTKDAKTGRRMAANSLRGLCLVVRGDPKGEAAQAARKPDSLPYDDLVTAVRTSIEEAKAPVFTRPGGSTATAPAPATGTTTGGTTGTTDPKAAEGSTTTDSAGRDPAPQVATPDPPSTTTTSSPVGGTPLPTKDVPAPPAGASGSTTDGARREPPPPPPEKK